MSKQSLEIFKYDNFLGANHNSLSSSGPKTELLSVILDLTPSWWLKYQDAVLSSFIDSIVAFSSLVLTFSNRKELAIIGIVPNKSDYIFTTDMKIDSSVSFSSITNSKNQYLQFAESKIRENIIQLIQESIGSTTTATAAASTNGQNNSVNLSGGFIKALCYFKRMSKLHQSRNNQSDFTGRFIIIRTGLIDNCSSFMSMMNAVFAAEKHSICIDVCILNPDESLMTTATLNPTVVGSGGAAGSNSNVPASVAGGNELFDRANVLRQSVDMTNGIYLTITKMRDLLQYFITLYLTSVDDRRFLTMINSSSVDIDFRASCFCHGALVSVGYVCSLCLAVFCHYSSACSCCWTIFRDRKLMPS